MTKRELALAGVALFATGTMAFHRGEMWAVSIREYIDGTARTRVNAPGYYIQTAIYSDGVTGYFVCKPGGSCQDEFLGREEFCPSLPSDDGVTIYRPCE